MAYFVLTHGLRERLIASTPARVVNTASDAHKGAKLDFHDLQSANDYSGFKIYARPLVDRVKLTGSEWRVVVAVLWNLARRALGSSPSA